VVYTRRMAPTAPLNTDHDLLRQTLESVGLEFLGVAAGASDHAEAANRYRQWLSEGRHGTMAFLERHEPGKYDPSFALPGTQSVVVAGLRYYQPRPELTSGAALVARYAWGRDYHKVLLAKLRQAVEALADRWPEAQWRPFTDTAPLDERYWAQQAGAAFTARNTLSISRTLGSWFLLGEILTTQAFAPTGPVDHAHGSCPSGCRRCLQVCPTGALDGQGRIDARRCISYLTIEHRGVIDDVWKPLLGNWLFGCDLCQEVCPFNLAAKATGEPEFLAWRAGPHLDLGSILALDAPGFTARFGGSPVHRTGRDGLVRNACLAAANGGYRNLLDAIRALADDEDLGVADAARWAARRLEEMH